MLPVPLTEAHDRDAFGGKASALASALAAGLPVPGGWALPVELVAAVGERRDPEACAAVAELAAGDANLAVRSSAADEDGAAASFAGRHLTRLNVRGSSELEEAVAEVWRSGHDEAALDYRRRMGITREPRVAVVVQHVVDAEVAGVLFSVDPMTGRDERVIEASWGLGEAVVSGLVTPDCFRVARGGTVLERLAGLKDIAVRPAPGGGTEEVDVPDELIEQLCLGDEQLAQLVALTCDCDRVFGEPHDLEWACTGGGELFLLQRRPLTRVAGTAAR